jgi:hypothetical protein
MKYPLVRDLAADGIPVVVTCRVLGFSKQAFYAWCRSPVSQRDWDEAHLINAALDAHHEDPAFGYRFIADERRAAGITAGDNRVPVVLPAADLVGVQQETRPEPESRAASGNRRAAHRVGQPGRCLRQVASAQELEHARPDALVDQ